MEKSLYDSSEVIEIRKAGDGAEVYTTVLNLIEFPKAVELKRLRVLYPAREDYDKALVWLAELLKRGKAVPATDLIVSAISVRLGLQLVTRDQHFRVIKSAVEELKLQVKR